MKENKIAHPSKNKKKVYSPPHTKISLGKKEKALLLYLYNNREKRFNIKDYARKLGKDRSSVYYSLDKLISKGIVKKPHMAEHSITGKGIAVIESQNKDIAEEKAVRREWGEKQEKLTLSTHYIRFILPLKDKTIFSIQRLKELNPLRIRPIELPNFTQYILYFEDATLIFNLNQISIRIHDILAEDTEEAHFQSFTKALFYIEKLKEINVTTERFLLDNPHYARIESMLADSLAKINNHYFIELKDGSKLWIDNSPPNRIELETNKQELQQKVDTLIEDVAFSDSKFSDIDKIKETLGDLTKLKLVEFKETQEINNKLELHEIRTKTIVQGLNSLSTQIEATNELIKGIASQIYPKKEKIEIKQSTIKPDYIG